MLFEQFLFFVFAAGALGGALGVVLIRNPFYSVLALVVHLFSLAILFLLLTAAFLAAAQIVVYTGAVMVLYLFVVAYVGGTDDELRPKPHGLANALGPFFAAAVALQLTIAVIGSSLAALDSQGAEVGDGFGSPGQIGEALLTKFLLPFEAASFLLLVAAVGAVVLARKRRGLHEPADAVSVSEVLRGGQPR
ncbi:MAG: NADH-quinone oxidoreductase subunit J [Solirubrobacterales bacterium]|nr:NADH-quinone oxidoreductase subunit J [Solirubrobacterales bacterium]